MLHHYVVVRRDLPIGILAANDSSSSWSPAERSRNDHVRSMRAVPVVPQRRVAVMAENPVSRRIPVSLQPHVKTDHAPTNRLSMLVSATIDVIDGKKLIAIFGATSAFRLPAAVVSKDSKSGSPVPRGSRFALTLPALSLKGNTPTNRLKVFNRSRQIAAALRARPCLGLALSLARFFQTALKLWLQFWIRFPAHQQAKSRRSDLQLGGCT